MPARYQQRHRHRSTQARRAVGPGNGDTAADAADTAADDGNHAAGADDDSVHHGHYAAGADGDSVDHGHHTAGHGYDYANPAVGYDAVVGYAEHRYGRS